MGGENIKERRISEMELNIINFLVVFSEAVAVGVALRLPSELIKFLRDQ